MTAWIRADGRLYARYVPYRLEDWPQFDTDRWRRATRAVDRLDYPESPARWSRKHRRICEDSYGRFLRWLDENDFAISEPPSRRFDRPAVVRFVQHLRGLGYLANTVSKFVDGVYYITRAIEPEHEWMWLRDVRNAARRAALAIPPQHAIAPDASALWKLGLNLMETMNSVELHRPFQREVQYRDGLMIAMLAVCPCRLQNFCSLRLGVHIVRQNGRYRVALRASETKAKRQKYETTLTRELTPRVDVWLKSYRPKLLAMGSSASGVTDALWVSIRGGPLRDHAVRYQLARRTSAIFGAAITPHRFRHAAATQILSANPNNAAIATAVLGHSHFATARHHYEVRSTLHASRVHARFINALRKIDKLAR